MTTNHPEIPESSPAAAAVMASALDAVYGDALIRPTVAAKHAIAAINAAGWDLALAQPTADANIVADLVEEIDRLRAEVDDLREAAQAVSDSADQARHIVEFSRTGYGLQHPLSCRPDLLRCPVQRHLAALDKPGRRPGRYFVDAEGAYEPTTVRDPLMPFIDALAALRAALAPLAEEPTS